MNLKSLMELECSSVVANNRMNRERKAEGINSYEKDIGLSPIRFIANRLPKGEVRWLDICCGQGNALIETASFFQGSPDSKRLKLSGIDLVDFFSDGSMYEELLELLVMNIENWQAASYYDLISIVHGLHYVGDKLKLIKKSVSALKLDGLLIANLDLNNIGIEGVENSLQELKKYFNSQEIEYNSKTKLLKVFGRKELDMEFKLVGVNDEVGSNYTGQPAVLSIYERIANS